MDKITMLAKWTDTKNLLARKYHGNIIANFMRRQNLLSQHIKSREQILKNFASVLNLGQLALLIWLKNPC